MDLELYRWRRPTIRDRWNALGHAAATLVAVENLETTGERLSLELVGYCAVFDVEGRL